MLVNMNVQHIPVVKPKPIASSSATRNETLLCQAGSCSNMVAPQNYVYELIIPPTPDTNIC